MLLTATGVVYTSELVEVRRAQSVFFQPGESFEIRAMPSKASRICSRDDLDAAVQTVAELSDTNDTIFMSVNPVRPDLGGPAGAGDVTQRSGLLIDIDPERPDRAAPATEAEKQQAVELSGRLIDHLTTSGWPAPAVYESGNGVHLRYRIDLPNDEESRTLIRRLMRTLAERFDTAGARIGTGVISAAQFGRVPGTWNRKGRHTPERPHRRATIVSMPDELEVVTVELIEAVAGPAPAAPVVAAAADRRVPEPASLPADGFTLIATADDRSRRYAQSARDQEYGRLALAPEGDRNNALNRAAFALGQFVGSGLLERDAIEADLLGIATRIGLEDGEAQATIRSGVEAGLAQPRTAPTPTVVVTEVCDEWPEPFLDSLPEAAPFPLEVLPGSLQELCGTCAESWSCPVDLLAGPVPFLAGGTIGRSVNLRVNNTFHVPSHLYGAIVAPPGTKKSPALELMSQPLREIDRELQEEYQQAMADVLADEPPPCQRHLVLDDFTQEVVGLIHSENPRGLVVIKDELLAWVKSLNAYRGGRGADEQFWLSVNSGMTIKVNRKSTQKGGTRESRSIARPSISIIGGLTPANLGAVRASDRDDGWADRLLFCYPELQQADIEWRSADIPDDLLGDWREAIRYLWDRQAIVHAGQILPQLIRLAPDALDVYRAWFRDHRQQANELDFPSELRGPWAKMEGYTLRFGLILSQLRQAYTGIAGPPTDVEAVDMQHADRLASYFKEHGRRALHALHRRDVPPAIRVMIPRLIRDGQTEFPLSMISRNYHYCFREPEDLDDTVTWLVKHHFIRPKANLVTPTAARRGRPSSTTFEINPRLLATGAGLIERLTRLRG